MNLGAEGMMTSGAFCASLGAYFTGSAWLGVLFGIMGGIIVSSIHSVNCVEFGGNQNISGLGLNTLAAGLSGFLCRELFGSGITPSVANLQRTEIFASIPVIGKTLSAFSPLAYDCIVVILLGVFITQKTTLGMRIVTVGDNPIAAETAGIDVWRIRHLCVSLFCGIYGGLAGEYLSIAAISEENPTVDDKVVMVWYDSTARKLYYSCNKEPLENANGKSDRSGWTTPVEVFDQSSDMAKAGEYCKVAVDSNGGVHIAAYDPINLDLVYAYLPKDKIETTSQSDFRTCIVDSNGVVGSNLTLDVGKVSNQGNVVPYIGYYADFVYNHKYLLWIEACPYVCL